MPIHMLKLAPPLEDSLSLSEGFAVEGLEALEVIEAALLCLEQGPSQADPLPQLLRPLHTLRSNAATLEMTGIHRLAHRMEVIVDWLHRSHSRPDRPTLTLLLQGVDCLRGHCHRLLRQPDSAEEITSSGQASSGQGPTPDVTAVLESQLDAAWRQLRTGEPEPPPRLGELLVQQGELRPEDLQQALELQSKPTGALLIALGLATPEGVASALARQQAHGPLHASIRIESRRVERITGLTTALLTHCGQLEGPSGWVPAPGGLPQSLAEIRRLARLLWCEVANLRQAPLSGLFQRLKRNAHDLAPQLGLEVEVICSGESLELEIEYLEALANVLTHAVRNALSHGIEPAEVRRRLGKPPAGRLMLSAIRENDEITLVVADDGRGLDLERVSQRARQLDLPDTTSLPDHRRWNVLFEPGFSTLDQPGILAGRGMGLNVIRETVLQLKGRVWLESEPGLGAGLMIQLPTRAGFVEGVVVIASGQRYVIPAESVLEYARPTWAQCREISGPCPALPLRGAALPLVWLAARVGRCPSQRPLWECLVVIVEANDAQVGLVVDDLVGPQRVPAFPALPGAIPGLAGRVVLEDGEAAELLTPEALLPP